MRAAAADSPTRRSDSGADEDVLELTERVEEFGPGSAGRCIAVEAGDMTVARLCAVLLRPMLQSWLDQNLPRMVEGAVRAEIERLSDRAEN